MEPIDIEKLAHEACFATQYEIKSKAQQNFYALCLNLSQAQLQELMKKHSQNVLFVTMEYIEKIVPTLTEIRPYFIVINDCVEIWFCSNTNATLIRGDGVPLQYHVENSVARTLGQFLKYMYLQKEHQEWVVQFIKERPNLRYRLYFWKLFIEAVSLVDNDLTFLVYRSLVYNFQQYIIPLIMDSLLPFFKSVSEEIQVNDLAIIQSKLTVQDNSSTNETSGGEISLFNPSELKFTQLVFQVLKEVICFNYNITYSEYQSEVPIENCLVCFPDPVTRKIANKEFVASIFFVADRLINDNFEKSNLNSVFLATTLQCIQKIMLTKLFYASSQTKAEFIKTALTCMSKLLGSKKLDDASILSLIQSNLKLLINIELHLIRAFENQFQVWIVRIKNVVLNILSRSVIHIDNQLVTEALELVLKIVEDSVAPQLKNEMKNFKNFGLQIIGITVEKILTQNQSLIGSAKVRGYDDLKRNLSLFLRRIRLLTCLNMELIFQKMEPFIVNAFQNNNVNQLSNIYFFFSQFCDSQILQKSIVYEIQEPSSCLQLGKNLYYCLQWIGKYHSFGQSVEIIEISILIFIQKLLAEALSNFSYDGQVKITNQIFKYINQGRPFMTNDQFLTFCYRQIARNLTNGDFNRSSYTFQVLTTLLLKFKWGIKRQLFKQTNIARNVLQLCKQLSQTQFDGQMLTLRKQLYKIITNISFDDTLDDYRANINQLIFSLERNLYKNRWRVMYDLTGICQAIDTSAIYRYFLITLQKSKISITVIMNQLFNHIEQASNNNNNNKMQLVKSILRLQLSMIDNKGQRLNSSKNIFYNYKLIESLMPYWAKLLELAQFVNEDWDEVIIQVYKIFNTLLKNGNTNFFMLERTIPCYPKFFKSFLFNMVNISKWVELYPQLLVQYRNSMGFLSSQLMQVIFCNKDPEIVKYFNEILNNFMDFTIKTIDALNQGNKTIENQVETDLQVVKHVFKYLKNAKKLEHKQVQINNFLYLNQGIEKKYNYILTLFKLGISSGKKMPRILQVICRIINCMDFLAGASIPVISEKLGLPEEIKQNLLKIWREVEENKTQYGSQLEDDGFVSDIMGWFKKCNTSTMTQPDY